jgi:hypothetical protein
MANPTVAERAQGFRKTNVTAANRLNPYSVLWPNPWRFAPARTDFGGRHGFWFEWGVPEGRARPPE